MEEDYIEITEEGKPDNIEKTEDTPQKTNKKSKIILLLSLGLILYFSYDYIVLYLLYLIKQNPSTYYLYLSIVSTIENNTLPGLFTISILGSIFFLMLPSEIIFIYYLSSTSHPTILIFLIVLAGNIIGLSFNYLFGRIVGENILRHLFKKNFTKYQKMTEKYGGIVLLVGNIFPGPIEVLSVFYGGFKYGMKKFTYLSALGRALKYFLILLAFLFFWEEAVHYYDIFISFIKNIIDKIIFFI